MTSPVLAEEVAKPAARPTVATAARKQSATAALALLPAFIDRHRWGNRNGVDDVIAALDDSHPAIAAKLKRYSGL